MESWKKLTTSSDLRKEILILVAVMRPKKIIQKRLEEF